MDSEEQYQISERDIEVAIRHLEFSDSKHATREDAIAMLKDLQSGFHGMAHSNPERLLELKKKLDDRKAQ